MTLADNSDDLFGQFEGPHFTLCHLVREGPS